MAKPKVSLCLIARDEEAFLPGCLESARGVVDEIVLVDTGSIDRTREIALAAGARVLERAWDDDFAAPRNLAASHARGDWILQLDADERLAPGSGAAVRRELKRAAFDVGMVRCHNADAVDAPVAEVLSGARRAGQPGVLPRLLRRTPDLRWEGCIHESVLEWAGARGNRLRPVALDLVHLGYASQVWDSRGKRARNLALLRKRVEQEPDSIISLGYLAQELLNDGQIEEAEAVCERGWSVLDRQPRFRAVRRLAVVRAAVAVRRRRPEVALETAERAEAREGANPDLAYHRGCALELLAAQAPEGERVALAARAAASFREALRLVERGGFEHVMHASPAQIWTRLGVLSLRAGAPAEALERFGAARAAGATERIGLAEAEALLALGDAARALRVLEPILTRVPEGWAVAARAAQALGAAEEARAFLAQARRVGVRG
jgi:tetratricopeptide (TPR) repeat protein